jgi:hypothetical protein
MIRDKDTQIIHLNLFKSLRVIGVPQMGRQFYRRPARPRPGMRPL